MAAVPDFPANSSAAKAKPASVTPNAARPTVEKIVVGEVKIAKKSLGRKAKDVIIEADVRSVVTHVFGNVLIPAAKNMMFDAGSEALKRTLFGNDPRQQGRYSGILGNGPRVNYSSPVNRGGMGSVVPFAARMGGGVVPAPSQGPRESTSSVRDQLIISNRGEAEDVLSTMSDICDQFGHVSVADMRELAGVASHPVDNNWGWVYVGDGQIRQVREGYLLDLPPAEPLQQI